MKISTYISIHGNDLAVAKALLVDALGGKDIVEKAIVRKWGSKDRIRRWNSPR